MTNTTTHEFDVRELAQRTGDGIEVTLLWNAACDRIWVQVYERSGDTVFEVPAAADQALNAFYHPYAYASLTGLHAAVDFDGTAYVLPLASRPWANEAA